MPTKVGSEVSVVWTALKLEPTGRTTWGRPIKRVASMFKLTLYLTDGHVDVEIPEGFETDLASMPSWLKWAYDQEALEIASVVHDFTSVHKWPALLSHAVMVTIMESMGAPKWQRRTVHWALLVAGPGGPLRPLTKWLGIGMSSQN